MESTVTPYRSRGITLDPPSARFQRFLQDNPGLQPEVFVGFTGHCVSPRSRVEQGLAPGLWPNQAAFMRAPWAVR